MQEIKEVIVNSLRSYRDATDEYQFEYNIDFILSEPCKFNVFGNEYEIDRIKMIPEDWGDEIELKFSNGKKTFSGIDLSGDYIIMVYERVKEEQRNGKLKGWSFDSNFEEILPEGYLEAHSCPNCQHEDVGTDEKGTLLEPCYSCNNHSNFTPKES